MNNPFLQQLRERTADWHATLEQNILSVNLMSEHVSKEDYRKYLAALYPFTNGFEKYIYPELVSFIDDIDQRKRAVMLGDDLRNLGQDLSALEPLDEAYFKAMYTDPYAALGALYVMEGSTLGGQLIQKHLQKTLGGEAENKTNYFVAHGTNTGTMWKSFLAKFTAVADQSGKQENIIDGALRTFRLLDQLMTDESVKQD